MEEIANNEESFTDLIQLKLDKSVTLMQKLVVINFAFQLDIAYRNESLTNYSPLKNNDLFP